MLRVGCPWSWIVLIRDHGKEYVDDGKNDGADEGCAKIVDAKPWRDVTGPQQDDGVDDQKKQAERQKTERQGDDLEQQAQRHVQEANDQHGDQGSSETGDMKAWNDVRHDQQGEGMKQPAQKQTNNGQVMHLRGQGHARA